MNVMKKKIILLALSTAAVTLLCGCGKNGTDENTTTTSPATPPATAPATPPTPPVMTNSTSTNNPPAAKP